MRIRKRHSSGPTNERRKWRLPWTGGSEWRGGRGGAPGGGKARAPGPPLVCSTEVVRGRNRRDHPPVLEGNSSEARDVLGEHLPSAGQRAGWWAPRARRSPGAVLTALIACAPTGSAAEQTNRAVARGEERGAANEAPRGQQRHLLRFGGEGSRGRRWHGDLPCPVGRCPPWGGRPERLSQAGGSGCAPFPSAGRLCAGAEASRWKAGRVASPLSCPKAGCSKCRVDGHRKVRF